jgi:hypothetical protein
MYIRAVVDRKGKILSVGLPDPEENEEEPILRSGPVLEEGEKEVALDLPGECERLPAMNLVQRVQMEIEKKDLYK